MQFLTHGFYGFWYYLFALHGFKWILSRSFVDLCVLPLFAIDGRQFYATFWLFVIDIFEFLPIGHFLLYILSSSFLLSELNWFDPFLDLLSFLYDLALKSLLHGIDDGLWKYPLMQNISLRLLFLMQLIIMLLLLSLQLRNKLFSFHQFLPILRSLKPLNTIIFTFCSSMLSFNNFKLYSIFYNFKAGSVSSTFGPYTYVLFLLIDILPIYSCSVNCFSILCSSCSLI